MTHKELWIEADWPAPDHIRAGITLRGDYHKDKPYSEINLANHVNDDPVIVEKNRELIKQHLSLKSDPIWLSQTHSNRIIQIDEKSQDLSADGSMTSTPNQICTILTADCVPILFSNKTGTQIAAIHSGWRGLCKGIVENALDKFLSKEILVWIGPHISQDHYEVGVDVYNAAIAHNTNFKVAFRNVDNQHWMCSLKEMITIILRSHGINTFFDSGLCTYSREDLFFSYRRDGNTGRNASMIWIDYSE